MADYFDTFAYHAARAVNMDLEIPVNISRDDRAAEALLSMLEKMDFQCFS